MSFDKKQLDKIVRAKIYSLVQSINDMFASQNYALHKSKNEIYQNILKQLDIENSKKQHQLDHAMLESSYEDKIQKQYFLKSLEVNCSQISQGDDGKSVCQNESFMVSPLWAKFGMDQKFKNQNQYQVTTYNQQQVDIFDTMVNENQVKLEYQQFTRTLRPQIDYEQSNQSDKQNQRSQNDNNDIKKSEKNPIIYNEMSQQSQQQKERQVDNQSLYQDESQQSQYSITSQEYLNYQRVLLKSNIKSQEIPYSKISKTNFKNKQRKYKSYTEQQKKQAIILAHEAGLQFSSRYYDIPKKNISRWMSNNKKTKQIRGRKPGNPGMQDGLTQWINNKIKNGIYVTQTQIRRKALELSQIRNPSGKSFKASKGWLQKYFKRNKQMSNALSFLLESKRNNFLEEEQKQMKELLKYEDK